MTVAEMVWVVAMMDCAMCNREWVACYPVEAPRLECPDCGYMNARPSETLDD